MRVRIGGNSLSLPEGERDPQNLTHMHKSGLVGDGREVCGLKWALVA